MRHYDPLEHRVCDVDRHFCTHGYGYSVARPGVKLDVAPINIQDNAGVKGLGEQFVDEHVDNLAIEGRDSIDKQVVGEGPWHLGLLELDVDGLSLGRANDDGQNAVAIRFLSTTIRDEPWMSTRMLSTTISTIVAPQCLGTAPLPPAAELTPPSASTMPL